MSGVYSLFVAGLAGRKARILAVEPQPEIYRRLAFNVAANDLGTIRTLQCAVADRDGTLDLFIDRGNRGQSSIAMVTGEKVSVPCRTLESVLIEAGFDRVDALKIDIEGAEDTVLVPFFATAPSTALAVADPAGDVERPLEVRLRGPVHRAWLPGNPPDTAERDSGTHTAEEAARCIAWTTDRTSRNAESRACPAIVQCSIGAGSGMMDFCGVLPLRQ